MKSVGRRKASSRPATTSVQQDTVPPLITELLATKFHTRAVKGYESEDRPNSDSKVKCKGKKRCHVSLGGFKKSRRAKGIHPATRDQNLLSHTTVRNMLQNETFHQASKQASKNAELPVYQASAHTPQQQCLPRPQSNLDGGVMRPNFQPHLTDRTSKHGQIMPLAAQRNGVRIISKRSGQVGTGNPRRPLVAGLQLQLHRRPDNRLHCIMQAASMTL